jgi:hypothetical protein
MQALPSRGIGIAKSLEKNENISLFEGKQPMDRLSILNNSFRPFRHPMNTAGGQTESSETLTKQYDTQDFLPASQF